MRCSSLLLLSLLPPLLLVACSGHGHDGHSHEGHDDHGHDHSGEGHHGEGHVHRAPRGGLLLTLAEESAHAELLHDPATGTLTLYLLDDHCEHPVRSSQERIELSLSEPSTLKPLVLEPVASTLTGETAGDTSCFRVVDPALARSRVVGSLVEVQHRGQVYRGVEFSLPVVEGDE